MGMFLNPDNSAFQAVLNAKIYVDKSGLLNYTNSVLASTDAFICNSRPRRFGKSITANMLTAYYSKGCDSEKMFSELEISEAEDFKKHLNKYDVIHLDIQWCMEPAGGPERIVSYISEKTIQELREYYPNVLKESTTSLPEALAMINAETGNKFIIIIDEWDVLIRDEAANQKVQEEYINFLRGMFKGTEPTKYIQLAYLTGILPIKREKTQSALNNFDEFTMLSPSILAKYIGFTSDEVVPSFPGRSFVVDEVIPFTNKQCKTLSRQIPQANITVRNFPLSVDELRKRTKIADGGTIYLFATTLENGDKVLIKTHKI